jgi:gamma-glutamyltranspeptidase/glutathione hydrolase
MPINRRQFLASSAAVGLPAILRADDAPKGLVVGQAEGAAAGNVMLAAGGNAVDAIVTAALVAGVVALPSTGLGGYGGTLIVAMPDGKVSVLDFNGSAPAAAKADMFVVEAKGGVKDQANAIGWKAAGVPGVLAGLQMALDKYGTKKISDAAQPAYKLTNEGFPISKTLAVAIKKAKNQFAKDHGSARLYLSNGEPLGEGEMFRNRHLAAMLAVLMIQGRVDDFYRGAIAKKIAAAFKENGGLVTEADLAAYKPREAEPLLLEWQGHGLYTPPPTAGGLTVLQTLATLKALDWAKWDAQDPKTTQARVEALRIGWDDRLQFLGDPEFTKVPVGRLLSEEYATESAVRIRAAIQAGKPLEAKAGSRPDGGTIHLNAVDSKGMMAALTFTHGESFGAQVTVDDLGLTLGHGMSRFDPRPGRANSIAPGKRPLHNMCPTIVLKDNKPMLALGATGGRRIPNTVFDVLCYRLGEGRDLTAAVKAPRLHTEGDLKLALEAAWPMAVKDHFKKVGYAVTAGGGANLSAIERDGKEGTVKPAAR